MPRGGVEEGGTAQHLQHAKHLTPSLSELKSDPRVCFYCVCVSAWAFLLVVSENELRRTTTAERSSVLLIRTIIYLASYLACDCPVLGRRGYEYVHGGAVVVEVWRVTKQTEANGGVLSGCQVSQMAERGGGGRR